MKMYGYYGDDSSAHVVSWMIFKRHFQNRFRDLHSDNYKFIQLTVTL